MAKYRKRPVIVDIEEYKPGMEDGIDFWCAWWEQELVGNLCKRCTLKDRCQDQFIKRPYIYTLENQKHYISLGDYIVAGVKGERNVIKPDILELTYEKVEEDE